MINQGSEHGEQQAQQTDHDKPRLSNELRHLIFQEMLSLKVSDSLPHGTFKRIAQNTVIIIEP